MTVADILNVLNNEILVSIVMNGSFICKDKTIDEIENTMSANFFAAAVISIDIVDILSVNITIDNFM